MTGARPADTGASSSFDAWRSAGTALIVRLWPAYLLASLLIFRGITWALPDGRSHGVSFQADENAGVLAVSRLSFPAFNPHWFAWGTALFYQVYAVERSLSLLHIVPYDNFWILVIGRAVTIASAFGCITLVFFIARELFDDLAGRIAAVILAVLPGFVINAHYFKTDVPMTFWLLAATLAACRLMKTERISYLLVLGFLVGYATAMKYSAAAFVPAALVAIGLTSLRRRPLAWTGFLLLVAVGFAVGEPRVFFDFPEIVNAVRWVARLNSAGIPYVASRPSAWLDYPLNVLPYAVTLPMLLLMTAGLVWAMVRGGRRLLPIWAFLVCYYLLMSNDNTRLVRYAVPLLPFGAILVGGMISAGRKSGTAWLAVVTLTVVSACYAFVYSMSYVQAMSRVDPRVQATDWIERNLPRDVRLPVILTHYSNLPDLRFMKQANQVMLYDTVALSTTPSAYLVIAEPASRFYREAKAFYPGQNEFLDFVDQHYEVVARFENSQRLFGIDSKAGAHLSEDWLRPNPRITIFKRRDGQGQ